MPAHKVIALGRSSPALEQLPVAATTVADLADPGASAGSLAGPVATDLRLDGLIHCAAIAERGNLADTDVRTWSDHLTLNVVAPAQLRRLLLPALRAAGGTVVFVNSVQGLLPRANSTVYATGAGAAPRCIDHRYHRDAPPRLDPVLAAMNVR